MKTQRELLVQFANELQRYVDLDRPADDPVGDARAELCKAHAIRLDAILSAPVNDGVQLKVEPWAMGIWVTLPAPFGGDPVAIRLADGSDLETGELDGLGARNLAVIRTLLGVAMNEINSHGATPLPVYPQPAAVVPPSFYGGH
jgi:hypothetical protein